MVSFLQRLALALVRDQRPAFIRYAAPPFGKSRQTVAQDRRRAKKARAVKRAKRHGQA